MGKKLIVDYFGLHGGYGRAFLNGRGKCKVSVIETTDQLFVFVASGSYSHHEMASKGLLKAGIDRASFKYLRRGGGFVRKRSNDFDVSGYSDKLGGKIPDDLIEQVKEGLELVCQKIEKELV